MSIRVVIIKDKVFSIDASDAIFLTPSEYKKYIDPDYTPSRMYTEPVNPDFASKGVQVYKSPNATEYTCKTALEIEGAELYDLSNLSAGQIKGLLRCEKVL